jgi:hypothetical protein
MAVIAGRVPSMTSDLKKLEKQRRERNIEPVIKVYMKYWLEFIYTDSLPPQGNLHRFE